VNARHAVAIARVDLRRRWRALKGNELQLLSVGILVLFLLPVFGAVVGGAYVIGRGEPAIGGRYRTTRLALVGAWLTAATVTGFQAVSRPARPAGLDGLLTTVSHRTLVGGFLVATSAPVIAPTALGALLAAGAFALGAGSAASLPLAGAAFALVLSTAIPTGFILAQLVALANARSALVARFRVPIVLVVGVGYVAVVATGEFASFLAPVFAVLVRSPVAWTGDLALLAADGSADPVLAAASVPAAAGFLVAVGRGITGAAEGLWYAEPVRVEERTEPGGPDRLAAAGRAIPRPAWAVARVDWKRARRAPASVAFVVYPLVVLVVPAIDAAEAGRVGAGLPLLVALSVPWIAGSLFTLNPLGNEGTALPVTALAVSNPRELLAGHVLAAATLVAPPGALAVVALGIAGPFGVVTAVSLGITAGALAVLACPLAAGIGAAFPRFEGVRVTRNREARIPSTLAFGLFSLGLAVLAAPALLAHFAAAGGRIGDLTGVPAGAVAVAGGLVTLCAAGAAAWLSARHAVGEISGFRYG